MDFRISVRSLVEFIFRSGDLDRRQGTGPDTEAMLKGGRLHRKLQKQMGSNYRPEVSLKYTREYEEYTICIEGRADGIQTEEGGGVLIDEIKGMYKDVAAFTEPVYVHVAQAMCYGYIYGSQNGLEEVAVQLTYANLDTEEIKRFRESYTMAYLEEWFEKLLGEYHRWIDFSWQWRKKRNASMQGLEFPFPYRCGQREIVSGVYRTILREKQLFIQAPTGVGKTMSVLFPSIRACGEGFGEKVFYLTARTITRTVAEEATAILRQRGLAWKSVTLTAKDKLCILPEPDCNSDICPRAKGHFDRVNRAVFSLLQETDILTREVILAHAERENVCPFEMMLDLSLWVDGVICDYNYVFDPRVQLKRFFAESAAGPYIFLIDEAHNLVDRGREMYSAVLYKEAFLETKKLVKAASPRLARLLDQGNKQLLALKRECDTVQVYENLGNLPIMLLNLLGEMDTFLEENTDPELRKKVLDFYFAVRTFSGIYDLLDENYVIYGRHDEEGRFMVKLFCVNPAVNLQKCLDKGRSSVFFSATLLPIQYYKSLFSTHTDDYAIYADTSFKPEQKSLLIAADVSSKYLRRGYEEYARIAAYMRELTRVRRGNYMVFFPSYRMLQDVCDIYEEQYGGEELLLQTPSMGEAEREEFLARFEVRGKNTLIGCCVMGGLFAEGIDLTGEKLIGALVVGTGFPQVSDERRLLMEFYNARGENGFDYAYRFPGMNKVLQSAGRVIRTAQDRGIIALLDERFLTGEYRRLFPKEWDTYTVIRKSDAARAAEAFWNKTDRDIQAHS